MMRNYFSLKGLFIMMPLLILVNFLFAQAIGTCSPDWTQSAYSACVSTSVTFTADEQGVNAKHVWSFIATGVSPISSTNANPTINFAQSGTYTIRHTVTVTSGNVITCYQEKEGTIDIGTNADASFARTPPGTELCADIPIVFTANSTGGIHNWTFGAGSSPSTGAGTGPFTINYSTGGIKTIRQTVNNGGCISYTEQQVTIIKPDADFTYPTGCTSNPVMLTSIQAGDLPDVVHNWVLPVGVIFDVASQSTPTSKNPKVIFSASGTYIITHQVVVKGCMIKIDKSVTIKLKPSAKFTFVKPLPCTTNFTVNFDADPASTHSWTFGDGGVANIEDPSHLYPSTYNTSYTVTHVATDAATGCTNTFNDKVIFPLPDADFTYPTGCLTNPVKFTSKTSTGIHAWTFAPKPDANYPSTAPAPPTSSATNPYITFTRSGYYTVTHIITYADNPTCTSTISKDVFIKITPCANFSYTNPNVNCMNTLPVAFTSITTPPCVNLDPVTDSWNFGDLNSGANNTATGSIASHQFSDFGTYTVKHTALNTQTGCVASTSKQVTITAPPDATFTYMPSVICPGDIYSFKSNNRCLANECIHTWAIVPPTGIDPLYSSLQDPQFKFDLQGSYIVTHTVTKGTCTNTSTQTVIVKSLPIPLFTPDQITTCAGLPACFTPVATGPTYSHMWQFQEINPPTTLSTQYVEHPCYTFTNPGIKQVIHTVSYVGSTGCISTLTIPYEITVVDETSSCCQPSYDYITPINASIIALDPNNSIRVNTVITVDNAQSVTWTGKTIYFGPAGKIEIGTPTQVLGGTPAPAKLVLSNCTLTSTNNISCGSPMWLGVQINYYTHSYPPPMPRGPLVITGVLNATNSEISYAKTGVRIGNGTVNTTNLYDYFGEGISFNNVSFKENYTSIQCSDKYPSKLELTDCDFLNQYPPADESYAASSTSFDFNAHIVADDAVYTTVNINSCSFEYSGTKIYSSLGTPFNLITPMHVGLYLTNPLIEINNCKFINLFQGIHLKNTNNTMAANVLFADAIVSHNILSSQFENCYYGIETEADNSGTYIDCNKFISTNSRDVFVNIDNTGILNNQGACSGTGLDKPRGNKFLNNPKTVDISSVGTALSPTLNYYYGSGSADYVPTVSGGAALYSCSPAVSCVYYSPMIATPNEDTNTSNWGLNKLYPNPATNQLTVMYQLLEGQKGYLQIFDVLGRPVLKELLDSSISETMVSIEDIPAGTYFVRISASGQVSTTYSLVVIK